MSAEEGSAQPPTAGTEKAPAPKAAAAFTTSFINKGGKKFAPKAARRRPAPTPAPSVEQTPQPESEPANAVQEPAPTPAPAVQLPTPAATQDLLVHDAPQPTPTPSSTEATTDATPAPTADEPLPSPAPPATELEPESEGHVQPPVQHTQDAQSGADTGRARKRRRMDPPAPKRTPVAGEQSDKDTSAVVQPDTVGEPQSDAVVGETEQAAAVSENAASTEAGAEEQVVVEPEAPRPRKRRTLPWNAVNRPQGAVEEEEAPVSAKKTRKPPKPRGKKKTAVADETLEAEQQDGADGSEAPPVQKRLSAKARGKRRADALDVEEGEDALAPAKRARRTRKVKSKATVTDADADEDGADPQEEEGQEAVVRRKPRQPRKKKRIAPEGEAEDGQDESRPKRRGRPPREPTPSDAEDGEIDPDNTFMDSIASRNIRVGKLSNREKSMREIDWDEVRRKRREEDTRPINTKEEREKADQLLASQQSQSEMPQIRVGADGNIEMVHASTTLDRNALAEREMETMEVHEERDLTLRITSRSFLKNNKRFPNDFLLPGQGKKWTADDTDLFYQGLRNFGTDFQMISHMFPTFTRVSIKHKFTREEREHPDAVREALLGRSEIVDNWDDFMQVSQMTEERFADTDRIMREMAEEESRMRVLINAAKAEADKVKEQKKEAGLLDKDGNEIGGEKENIDSKGKKKRKGKEKTVTFQEEPGVEVLGAADDDATWGKE